MCIEAVWVKRFQAKPGLLIQRSCLFSLLKRLSTCLEGRSHQLSLVIHTCTLITRSLCLEFHSQLASDMWIGIKYVTSNLDMNADMKVKRGHIGITV